MPRATESSLTTTILHHYRAMRPMAEVYKINDRISRDIPDFLIVDGGSTWFWEVKRTDNRLSPGQTRAILRLQAANKGRVGVIWLDMDTKRIVLAPLSFSPVSFPVPTARDESWPLKNTAELLVKFSTKVLTP